MTIAVAVTLAATVALAAPLPVAGNGATAVPAAAAPETLGTIPAAAPFHRLELPDEPGEVLVFGTVAAAGPPEASSLHLGWSLGLLFRPRAAADFLEPLYRLNLGLVLQAQGNGAADGRSLLAADFILRRYAADTRRGLPGRSLFAGAGLGLARASWPAAGGTVRERWWSPLVEVGVEVSPRPGLVLLGRFQYRWFGHFGQDLSGWSTHLGAAVPFFL